MTDVLRGYTEYCSHCSHVEETTTLFGKTDVALTEFTLGKREARKQRQQGLIGNFPFFIKGALLRRRDQSCLSLKV